MRALIIAEAGVNHNGDLKKAKQLVASAAAAGADVVKFQTFVTDKIMVPDTPKAEYQKGATNPDEGQSEMVRELELSRSDHEILINECRSHGIRFLSTAFDTDSFDMLIDLGLDCVKIPSGEITNLPLLRHISRLRLPILLSTGMANMAEIEHAIDVVEQVGTPREMITILHCNTEYPTPVCDVNLRAMVSLKVAFGCEVGYSDHTAGIEMPIAAVSLGASVIEKHFTLDRTLPGPDHLASLEPQEFKSMVVAIRNVERALGDGIKRPSPSEQKNKAIARKSLVASRAIHAGELFSASNITAKRPGTGLSPMLWDEVVGRRASRDFLPNELIKI